ncbi:apolipoprotein N-acyltransferase [Cupriavidus gilardii]|uniref:apolipoprotein N-acyltransferase n=1 Tax=Cupriavidus gilardii TaxID=82541 RepID=UPI001EE57E83|nr:apolipoprotein N-acyltransferase [Cupriavidus gilardii]MCG5260903.1 apolipoprotein N-acyltransferase [Cupriavidus gilardii]MDF9428882.1 apolipoprotein N-acyltransferase [Cupriavidus gilardii]
MKRLAQGWNGAAAAELETPLSEARRARARWGRLLVAGVLGVAHTQAFAPRDWWWLQLLALAGLAALLFDTRRARDAAALGYAFGLGWFLSGIWWVYISMHVYGEMPAWMAALAVLLFSGYLALYPALAAAAWHRATAPRRFDPARRGGAFGLLAAPLAFGAAWGLSEWLRGVIFTGFPWLASGYAHTDGPLAGYAPLLGVYGISALAAVCAAWLAALARVARPTSGHDRRAAALSSRLAVPLGLVVLLGAGWLLAGRAWTEPVGEPLSVRLLQGNVPQDIKFEAAGIARSNALYHDMITAAPADLVVTPETAFPLILQDMPPEIALALRQFSVGTGTALLFGAAGADSPVDFTNSVFGIGPEMRGLYRYDKHHLVPFGEFIPWGFRWFVDMMKMPLGDFRRGGLAQAPLPVRGVTVAPNICYEDLFGEEIARTLRGQPQPANVLVNLTNLAWFGDTIALDQHLQISRMRALETRRPMLRSTNTGMTAVVAPDGSVQARLATFTTGTLSAQVQGTRGLTPYVRVGNVPAVLGCLLVLLLVAWRAGRPTTGA